MEARAGRRVASDSRAGGRGRHQRPRFRRRRCFVPCRFAQLRRSCLCLRRYRPSLCRHPLPKRTCGHLCRSRGGAVGLRRAQRLRSRPRCCCCCHHRSSILRRSASQSIPPVEAPAAAAGNAGAFGGMSMGAVAWTASAAMGGVTPPQASALQASALQASALQASALQASAGQDTARTCHDPVPARTCMSPVGLKRRGRTSPGCCRACTCRRDAGAVMGGRWCGCRLSVWPCGSPAASWIRERAASERWGDGHE